MGRGGAIRRWAVRIAIALTIVGLAVFANASQLLQRALETLEGLGPAAPALFLALYVATCVLFVPSFVFTFAAGALFGLPLGVALSLLGTGLGSVAAFAVGRHLARDAVTRAFAENRQFQALAGAVARRGWKIVALARLSPVFPFLVGNYAFGVTGIPARHYFVASVLGTIPSATVYVYVGTLAGDLAAASERGRTPLEWALFLAGLAATVILTLYVRRVARVALEREVPS